MQQKEYEIKNAKSGRHFCWRTCFQEIGKTLQSFPDTEDAQPWEEDEVYQSSIPYFRQIVRDK